MQHFYSQKNTTRGTQKGFVAVFAVLIATVILVMVISATGIAYKETVLSSTVRESEQAFYATDTGVECGLYLDRIANIFTTGVSSSTCGGIDVDIESATATKYIFDVPIGIDACAKVEVDKDFVEDGVSFTQVTSRGYNVSCENLEDLSSRRVVERKLDVRYPNPIIVIPEIPGGGAV